jgi:hypothetical protein
LKQKWDSVAELLVHVEGGSLKEPTEHACYRYSFHFERAGAQKWAQSALLRDFEAAVRCSKFFMAPEVGLEPTALRLTGGS